MPLDRLEVETAQLDKDLLSYYGPDEGLPKICRQRARSEELLGKLQEFQDMIQSRSDQTGEEVEMHSQDGATLGGNQL